MALLIKRQVNVGNNCLRKQTNCRWRRIEQCFTESAQFVSAIMPCSLTALPQSSFSFTLLQLSLPNFVPKPWRTRKLHCEYDIVDLHLKMLSSWKWPKSKAHKIFVLFASCTITPLATVLVGQDGFYVSGDPSCCCVIPYAGGGFIHLHKCIICIFLKRNCYPPNFFYKPRTPLPNL